ncbi:MAG: pilus assembly protein PilM [Opitutales bacterium]|jgi:type IV pilus assembly protein PilM|nr:pilus assembly protein PilM [Opitutales bacterium]MDP4643597.1 pilus assembly protein PilM [Opitutales bacterium]MDP4778321.1 pilus assembly protein PilM [Opitutales bacterium]
MSNSKRLIINCGASRVTAAYVSPQGNGFQIDKLVYERLQYDYSNDDAWIGAVGDALQTLARTHKLSGKATIIIPGNQVLTKTIRIANVDESKRAQVIAFEAQQNIPYPLHEVVWDSQVVGDDGVETEVLFIACKSNTIDDICRSVASAGLVVEAISAATVLDFNALQFAYPGQTEDVLLINVGARSTNLLFCNGDEFFVRNIALGGNTLTQNIADSIGKPFAQAQEVKHKFFGDDSSYSDDDSGGKLLTTCADSFIRRMSQEITRSIVNYRRQKQGNAPKRILLNGRGALLTGLAEKLSESQKIKVEYFDPLQGVTLDADISIPMEELRLQVGEIIGEAVRKSLPDSAGVNLLPDDIQSEMAFSAKKPFLYAAAILFALAPWPAYVAYKQVSAGYEEVARATQAEVAPIQGRKFAIQENAEKAKALGDSIKRVEGLLNSKTNWIQFFAELQESLTTAEDVWLDDLKVIRAVSKDGKPSYEVVVMGQMLVRDQVEGGTAIDEEVLTRRINGLQSSFEESEFVVSSVGPTLTWTRLREGLPVLPFSINLVIDPAKPL